MLALQQRFNLIDEDLEFQVNDRRLSKYRFREFEHQPQAGAADLARAGAAEAPCHASRSANNPQTAPESYSEPNTRNTRGPSTFSSTRRLKDAN